MKYHVHIYKVVSMAELEVEASSEEEANAMGSKNKDKLLYGVSDCKHLALAFKVEDKKEEKVT